MPGFFSSSAGASFVARPAVASLSVLTVSTLFLLIPVCLRLSPLGSDRRHAKSERDLAQGDYNNAFGELNTATAALHEAKTRMDDLDCARTYPSFNTRMNAFQEQVASFSGTATEELSTLWGIDFVPDTVTQEQTVRRQSWQEGEYRREYYYSCINHKCGKDTRCCSDWGWRWTTVTHYYDETTRIENLYKNIATGPGLSILPLNCGYYSRQFQTLAPATYKTDEQRINSGDRNRGHTYVDITRQFGSQVPKLFQLDDALSNTMAIVPRGTTQVLAADDLARQLFQFLTVSLAAFDSTGINYPDLQREINSTIPRLVDGVTKTNATAYVKSLILAQKQTVYNEADSQFKQGLSLWLPMFFLLPGGAALLTYLLASYYKSTRGSASHQTATVGVEIELPAGGPSAYHEGPSIIVQPSAVGEFPEPTMEPPTIAVDLSTYAAQPHVSIPQASVPTVGPSGSKLGEPDALQVGERAEYTAPGIGWH
jgi:hypothetical protein